MRKTRVRSLEKKMRINEIPVKWSCVYLQNGIYTTEDTVTLTEDADGNLLYEHGEEFYNKLDESTALIIRHFV